MNIRRTTSLPVAKALLLIGLLLVGRAFLATHHYDHDLAQLETECEVCEFFHAFKDDGAPSVESESVIETDSPSRLQHSETISFLLRTAYLPRAPPVTLA